MLDFLSACPFRFAEILGVSRPCSISALRLFQPWIKHQARQRTALRMLDMQDLSASGLHAPVFVELFNRSATTCTHELLGRLLSRTNDLKSEARAAACFFERMSLPYLELRLQPTMSPQAILKGFLPNLYINTPSHPNC